MVTNGGNSDGLFRAAFMQSGSPFFVGDIAHGQKHYDALVDETGCSTASDTLQCLREAPYDMFSRDLSPSSFVPVFAMTRAHFSFTTLNITTDTQLEEWIQTYWVPNAPSTVVQEILRYYPADITQGSPFDTGTLNALTPQFKRIAAFQGDIVLPGSETVPLAAAFRKVEFVDIFEQTPKGSPFPWICEFQLLDYLSSNYPSEFSSWEPFFQFHGSDFLIVYRGEDLTAYLVRFVANLDPNGDSDLYWPQYTTAEPNMLELLDRVIPQALTQDTYRAEAIEYLINLTLEYPL
ncbi:Alpha/Beta hydrolase protein [Melanogaster broomeanus]|nr:Alpha/Beta hydrolase protein [Melanogaster broomeanus]